MSKQRRIILRDATGSDVMGKSFDVTDVDHANTQCVLSVAVEETCDMGRWHTLSQYLLPKKG